MTAAPQRIPLVPGEPFTGLVQAAGVIDVEEACMLSDLGFHSLGFPLRLPVHTPDTTEEEAAAIIARLPPAVIPVLITYEPDPQRLLDLARFLRVRHVQLHAEPCRGESDPSVNILSHLRQNDPTLFLIKSLIVGRTTEEELLARAALLAPLVDAFLLDSHDPAGGATGATGRTHDWEVSRRLVGVSPRPVILAGGLRPDNVAKAVEIVRPAGVDAHTGLEGPNGRKDPDRCLAFLTAARRAMALR